MGLNAEAKDLGPSMDYLAGTQTYAQDHKHNCRCSRDRNCILLSIIIIIIINEENIYKNNVN